MYLDFDVARNRVPWIIIGICYFVCSVLLLVIRGLLAKENKKRDKEPPDDRYIDAYIETTGKDGKKTKKWLDKMRFSMLQMDIDSSEPCRGFWI
jgi:hypothetical protein